MSYISLWFDMLGALPGQAEIITVNIPFICKQPVPSPYPQQLNLSNSHTPSQYIPCPKPLQKTGDHQCSLEPTNFIHICHS